MVRPLQDSISEAASRVCGKVKLLSSICKKIMKTVLRTVSNDIMAGKTPRDTCVDIKMCKPKPVSTEVTAGIHSWRNPDSLLKHV